MALNIPALARGRAQPVGPTTGNYTTFAVTVDNLANSETPEFDFKMPCDVRIQAISTGAEAATAGSGLTVTVKNAGTDVVAAYTITTTPTENTLVTAERDLSKGDLLSVNISAAADASATGLTILITVEIVGFVQASLSND
jgi:hypothetical protein